MMNVIPVGHDIPQKIPQTIYLTDQLESLAQSDTKRSDDIIMLTHADFIDAAKPPEFTPEQDPEIIIYSANMVTGPTPTFQVSIMDIGRELRNEIAMAQALQSLGPGETDLTLQSAAPDLSTTNFMGSNSILSSDLSTPTERRDSKESQHDLELEKPSMDISEELPHAPQLMSTQIQDPEAAYAGEAALQERPYADFDIAV